MYTKKHKIDYELEKDEITIEGENFIKLRCICTNQEDEKRILHFCCNEKQYAGINSGYIFNIRKENYIYEFTGLDFIYVYFGVSLFSESIEIYF